MTHAEVAALPIGDYADDQCHLYLWVTNPRLFADKAGRGPSPAEMMAGWGFEYTTTLTWQKLGAPGLGWYFRGATEHVLFGVKGKLGIPTNLRVSNHFAAAKGAHSAKPDRFYEIVERVSPAPRLEMFARRRRYEWDVWGNEAPEHGASQAVLDLEVSA
jgi:N6-adenosine-specific RNA methylase IME4